MRDDERPARPRTFGRAGTPPSALASCGNALPLLPGGQVVVQSGGAKARNVLGTGYLMDNRDYPCSVMPDALCCWVFHLPPNAGLCVRYVWDSRHVTEPSERVGPRPSAIGYVAKGGIAAI